MTRQELIKQLQKQLGFLQNSCESYDAGKKDEAIRIAQVVRVLIHDTKLSTSLLSQLDVPHIRLLSTSPVITPDKLPLISGLSRTRVRVEGGNRAQAEYIPMLDSHIKEAVLMSRNEWWEQVVYILNEWHITRRQIVLTAANKDGGAHVDPLLPPEYEALKKGTWTLSYSICGDAREVSIENLHFSDLRQIGFEILNSPDILSLTR